MKFIITIIILLCNSLSVLAKAKVYDIAVRHNNILFVSSSYVEKESKDISVFLMDINGIIKRKIKINKKHVDNDNDIIPLCNPEVVLYPCCIKCSFIKFFSLLNTSLFKLGIGSNFYYGCNKNYCIGNIFYFLIKFFL
jgi:hypothetical protein